MARQPAVEPGAMAAWQGFLQFHARVTDAMERELLDGADMPLTWFDVLVQLAATPDGRLRMQDLAAAVVLSRSGLTRLVDRLEREGYVSRTSCPSDRRGMFAEITPAGRAALRRARPVHVRGIAEHFANVLSGEDVEVLESAFGKLLDGLGPCPSD